MTILKYLLQICNPMNDIHFMSGHKYLKLLDIYFYNSWHKNRII